MHITKTMSKFGICTKHIRIKGLSPCVWRCTAFDVEMVRNWVDVSWVRRTASASPSQKDPRRTTLRGSPEELLDCRQG